MEVNTAASPRVSKANLRERLSKTGFSSGDILLDDVSIGRFVSYGKGRGQSSAGAKTVYGSRIYRAGLKIEVEAQSTRVLLDKVAGEIAKAIKSGAWAQ